MFRQSTGHIIRRQHRELGLGPPAALREDARPRHTFAPHADLLHHADARMMIDRDAGGDAIEPDVAKAKGQDAADKLGAVAAASVGRSNADTKARNLGMRARATRYRSVCRRT